MKLKSLHWLQLKRLRELAALIIESDANETLPSNGVSGAISGSDASAAASTGTGDSAISDIKQNIDQVILKYVKEVSYMFISDKSYNIS